MLLTCFRYSLMVGINSLLLGLVVLAIRGIWEDARKYDSLCGKFLRVLLTIALTSLLLGTICGVTNIFLTGDFE